MTMLGASIQNRLRRRQLKTLTQTAIVRRSGQVSDGAGGSTETVTYIVGLPCRVAVGRLQRGEILIAGQLAGGLPWTLTFEHDADIRLADRINVDGTLVDVTITGGRWFDVLAIYGQVTYISALQVVCAER